MIIRKIIYSLIIIIIFPTHLVGGIEAGASKLDITPQVGLSMYGYGARKGVSTGVLDPLYVRVLVLRSDERSIAIIHYDLGQTFAENVLSELKQKITADCRQKLAEHRQVHFSIFLIQRLKRSLTTI